jgi:hypothetical protein
MLRITGRWAARAMLLLGMTLGLLALPMLFTTQITPPLTLADGVTVIVVDHGDTPTLVLPGQDGGMVRYAYGEWRWYALGETSYLRAIPTLAWPTQGALGRQEMTGPLDEQTLREQMRVGFQRLHRLQVERERANALRAELDRQFQANIETRVFNAGSDLHFVHHRRQYTYFFNSNHMLAAWLEELGCELSGHAYGSRWQVEANH